MEKSKIRNSDSINAQETYEELQSIRRDTESLEDEDSEQENGDFDENEAWNNISRQPKGWWSQGNIIASLPERKIKQAIENYRQAISLLENELVSRRISPTRHYSEITGFSIQETGRSSRRRMQQAGASRRQNMGILKKLRPRLRSVQERHGREVKDMLEDTWRKILEVYYETKEHK